MHSPFAFNIYSGLIDHHNTYKSGIEYIERERRVLKNSQERINVNDLGAGSKFSKGGQRLVSTIAKHSCSPLKFSLLYQYFCKRTPANNVLELGASLGLNTEYLNQSTHGTLYTFEGCPTLLGKAKQHLSSSSGIEFIAGDIDQTLSKVLNTLDSVDFALLDANHKYLPTKTYFNALVPLLHQKSIVVVSDIYWSRQMAKLWEELKGLPNVSMSMDFYECGVLFFHPADFKHHFILNY